MDIWIISDTHFNHENIKKYENRPEDFNELIIENWNKVVKPNDLVLHLGDVILGQDKDKHMVEILKRLNGRKILTIGNHDPRDWRWYLENGFDFVSDFYVVSNVAFSHAPLTPLPYQTKTNHGEQVAFNIHGHFHRGKHRVPTDGNDSEFVDPFYDYQYYLQNKEKYYLIQIEDTLAPFPFDEVIKNLISGVIGKLNKNVN